MVPPLRVAHNVLMGRLGRWSSLRALWNLVWPSELDVARAALARVELEDRLWALPDELSGGEQQRVAIARAIAKQPTVMFCDEPTGALDSATGVRVLRALLDATNQTGATTLIITHNAGVAAMADRVLMFKDGALFDEQRNSQRKAPEDLSW